MLNPCHATPVNNEKFFKKYSIETHGFCLVFIALFTSLKFYTFPGSYNNVEQWINLTNQMFYGSQDFLFSYGPLYWLTGGTSTQYSHYTYWLSIAFLSMLSAFFWSSIFTLSYKVRTIYSLVGVYFIFFNSLLVPVSLILWPFSMIAYLEFSRSTPIGLRTKGLILFGLLVGASFYIRFFYGFVGTVTFLSYFFTRIFSQKNLVNSSVFWLA